MAKTHRVIRLIEDDLGRRMVCLFCGANVADTDVHKQYHLRRDMTEIYVEREAITALTNPKLDYPDKWQQAELDRRAREAEEAAYQARVAREREEAKAASVADVERLRQLLADAEARREELHREPAV